LHFCEIAYRAECLLSTRLSRSVDLIMNRYEKDYNNLQILTD